MLLPADFGYYFKYSEVRVTRLSLRLPCKVFSSQNLVQQPGLLNFESFFLLTNPPCHGLDQQNPTAFR